LGQLTKSAVYLADTRKRADTHKLVGGHGM
jgi:hypothetical protein